MGYSMITYAHNNEDIILNRVFRGRTDGFYVDVGASHPDVNSVTRHFSQLGWSGVNVEPNPAVYRALCQARPRDVNLEVAVSDREGSATYYEALDCSAESTLSEELARAMRARGRSVREHRVEVLTLATILTRYATDRTIDFLSIDVEGHERAVLSSVDFSLWRPRVVVIEAVEPCTNVPAHHRWESLLLDSGYLFTLFDGINRFYVRQEDRDWVPLLSYPASPLDGAIRAREYELALKAERYGRLARIAAGGVQRMVNSVRGVLR
jgi:FkbM family methyltransferase